MHIDIGVTYQNGFLRRSPENFCYIEGALGRRLVRKLTVVTENKLKGSLGKKLCTDCLCLDILLV